MAIPMVEQLAPWLAWTFPLAAPTLETCPSDMVPVVGVHHEEVQKLCTDLRQGKCWGFFPELILTEPRDTPVATCMDRYEWPNQKGADPVVMLQFVEAEEACAKKGKRLCTEFEWELACEGPRHLPWPHGWKVDPQACHNDRPYRSYDFDALHSRDRTVRDRETRRLYQAAPSGSHPGCRSHYGVDDLVGNVEEWVVTSRPQWPYRSSLKGGFWAKPWSGCRGTNESHSPQFRFYEIGFRCCLDPPKPEAG